MTNGILTASFFPNVPAAQSVADKKKKAFPLHHPSFPFERVSMS